MGRSALDRLAISAVFIAGTVEAAQTALANSPAVTRAVPVLNLSGSWNYVPFAFICIATGLWFAERVALLRRPRRGDIADVSGAPTVSAPAAPPRQTTADFGRIARIVAVPGISLALIIGIVFLIGWGFAEHKKAVAAQPDMKWAPVIRGSITLAQVRQTLRSQDPATAEQSLSRFLGTPMRASGVVHASTSEFGSSLVTLTLTDPQAVPVVYLIFQGDDASGMALYGPGDHIAADCKIERLDASGIGLDGCVRITGEAWTSLPASSGAR